MYEFDRSTPVTVSLRAQAGLVVLTARERTTVAVQVLPFDDSGGSREAAEQTEVTLDGDTLVIRAPGSDAWSWRRNPKLKIVVDVPAGSSLTGNSAAADVWADGSWSVVRLDTASAGVEIAEVRGDADLDSQSGDLTVHRVGGALRVRSAAGRLRLGDVTGDADLRTASGAIQLTTAGASLRAESASGDIEIGRLSRGQAQLKTASGDIRVGVAAGTALWMDLNSLSGKATNTLTPAPGDGMALELHARSLSGDIAVHRAVASQAPGFTSPVS